MKFIETLQNPTYILYLDSSNNRSWYGNDDFKKSNLRFHYFWAHFKATNAGLADVLAAGNTEIKENLYFSWSERGSERYLWLLSLIIWLRFDIKTTWILIVFL